VCPSLGCKIGIAGETEMMIDISTGDVAMHGAASGPWPCVMTLRETTRTVIGKSAASSAFPPKNRPPCRRRLRGSRRPRLEQ
jgi:hypothetical protein